jgi:Fic family protein
MGSLCFFFGETMILAFSDCCLPGFSLFLQPIRPKGILASPDGQNGISRRRPKMNRERQGYYREHGRGDTYYRSFVPTPLQEIALLHDEEMDRLLQQAYTHLHASEQKDKAQQEARSSVKLAYDVPELSILSMDDSADKLRKRKEEDCHNLLDAMDYGLERLQVLPLSARLLKDLHWVAMRAEHNGKKYPGEFRSSPVWIGSESDTLSTAPFVPPVGEDMTEAFTQLERYINYEERTDPLVMAALIHYQFEVIHPFIDGNGRMGRLLTLLFLIDRGVLSRYSLALSSALNLSQFRYFTGLASVEISGTYEKWVKFFLGEIVKS